MEHLNTVALWLMLHSFIFLLHNLLMNMPRSHTNMMQDVQVTHIKHHTALSSTFDGKSAHRHGSLKLLMPFSNKRRQTHQIKAESS